jgi:hypothetical protein
MRPNNIRIRNLIVANCIPMLNIPPDLWGLRHKEDRTHLEALAQGRGIRSTKGLVRLAKELRRVRSAIKG